MVLKFANAGKALLPSFIGVVILLFSALLQFSGGWSQTAENQSSEVDRGRVLIRELGCVVCHDIKEHHTSVKKEAPHLTYEGDIVRRNWLFAFLKSPRSVRPAIKARMPDFRLTDREALAITEYLGSLVDRGKQVPKNLRYPRKEVQKAAELAKKLMSKDYFDCFSCHILGDKKPSGKPDEWAPDLTKVRSRINPDFFFKWLRDPGKYRPGTKMPAFFPDNDSGPDDILGGDEIKQIAVIRDYLMSIGKIEIFPAYAKAKAKFPDVTGSEGRSLVVKLNCVGCHKIAMLPEGKKVGPNLTFQGSRVRKEWLTDFLRRPYTIKPEYALMGSAARMPTFPFKEAELRAVVEYISQVLVDKELGRKVALGTAPAKGAERLFREKRCNNCHRIGSKPGGIGPDLTGAGKRLRPEWTIDFILRPSRYLHTRMPNLHISHAEAKTLAAYILSAK